MFRRRSSGIDYDIKFERFYWSNIFFNSIKFDFFFHSPTGKISFDERNEDAGLQRKWFQRNEEKNGIVKNGGQNMKIHVVCVMCTLPCSLVIFFQIFFLHPSNIFMLWSLLSLGWIHFERIAAGANDVSNLRKISYYAFSMVNRLLLLYIFFSYSFLFSANNNI